MSDTRTETKPGDRIRVIRCADPAIREGEVYVAGRQTGEPGTCCLLHPDLALLADIGDEWEVAK